jgi:hypothetical protein
MTNDHIETLKGEYRKTPKERKQALLFEGRKERPLPFFKEQPRGD